MNKQHSESWYKTPTGEERGYIIPHALDELWFHTGTRCNLECSFCLEGSSPSSKRLQGPKLSEVKPFIDEALALGVKQFSFTGGEPFLLKDMIDILAYASQFRPCLVLTNGTTPLIKRLPALQALAASSECKHPISLRISLDSAESQSHDAGRGQGNFALAISGLKKLHRAGFKVSVARHMSADENSDQVTKQFQDLFALNGLPEDLNIVAFPDFLPPGSIADVPHISSHCMVTYQTEQQRKNYMCSNSKMIIKKNDQMQVYACTLVDDDEDYHLANTLSDSMSARISMKHHRCYSCFAHGASCSE
ncbi:radical SAM protein [Thalassotalea montiporae]